MLFNLKPESLYIHIPFCKSKCRYCDFFSLTPQHDKIVEKVLQETFKQIVFFKDKYKMEKIKTLYIGGGTPNSIPPEMFKKFTLSVLNCFDKIPEEFTVEINPESFTPQYYDLFSELPVSRISAGIQSFSRKYLEKAGRSCTPEKNHEVINLLKNYKDKKINLDIISSFPDQSEKEAIEDAETANYYKPDHISLYSLTVEKNTAFYSMYLNSIYNENCWIEAADYLYSEGYDHYEISNFSLLNSASIHNMNYWQMKPYIGCGVSAVSTVFECNEIKRITVPSDINSFLTGADNFWGCEVENISYKDHLIDILMMGTRTSDGIAFKRIHDTFNLDIEQLILKTLTKWENSRMLVKSEKSFNLNRKGRLFHSLFMIDAINEIESSKISFT